MEGLKLHSMRKETRITFSKGKPSLRPTSGFGNQTQTLLKNCSSPRCRQHPWTAKLQSLLYRSHYTQLHTSHHCLHLHKPTFPKMLLQEKPVCASGHSKQEAKMVRRLWRTIDPQVTWPVPWLQGGCNSGLSEQKELSSWLSTLPPRN